MATLLLYSGIVNRINVLKYIEEVKVKDEPKPERVIIVSLTESQVKLLIELSGRELSYTRSDKEGHYKLLESLVLAQLK